MACPNSMRILLNSRQLWMQCFRPRLYRQRSRSQTSFHPFGVDGNSRLWLAKNIAWLYIVRTYRLHYLLIFGHS